MKIRLWKGYHSTQLKPLIDETWNNNDLLILCPPHLKIFSFVDLLPEGEISLVGEWEQNSLSKNNLFKNEIAKTSLTESTLSNNGDGAENLHNLTTMMGTEQCRASTTEGRSPLSNCREKPVLGVFTSGTTSGEPRLVLYTKENILSSLKEILTFYDEKRITSIFCYPQPFHTFGLLLGYVLSIYKKIPLHIHEGKYSKASHEARIKIGDGGLLTLGTPTHFFDLIEIIQKLNVRLAPTYTCIMGGAPVGVELWERVQSQLNILLPSIGYGCTEASPGITHHPPGQKPTEYGEIGYPLKSLNSVVIKDQGVEIRGSSLCLAFGQKGELIFPESLIVKDSVEVRSDGMWVYKGRLDYMLNRGGIKISLEHIEKTILRETNFQVVSVARPDLRLGEELCILLRPYDAVNSDRNKNFEIISKILKENFSLHLSLSDYKEVGEFPMNESLKVDRKVILDLFHQS